MGNAKGSKRPPETIPITALGDVVNTTARLASTAAAGELLVSAAAAEAADYAIDGLERRTLEVRGRHEPIDVVVISRSPGQPPLS